MTDTKRPLTVEEVRALLLKLAAYEDVVAKSGPDRVAAALRVLGVKGKRNPSHGRGCPVWSYLKKHGAELEQVVPGHAMIRTGRLDAEFVRAPVAVLFFGHAFDCGDYPDLEAA